MSEAMVRIIYLSRAVREPGAARTLPDMDAILEVSRHNNARVSVTGALIYNGGEFGQVLDGPEDAVEEIFSRIEADPRHTDVEVLDLRTITERAFPDWAMGQVGRDGPGSWTSAAGFAGSSGDAQIAALYRRVLGGDAAIASG